MSKALPTPEDIGASARAAPCPHYAACGGCSLQHVSEDFYRAWKIKILEDALTGVRVGKFNDPVFLPPATRRRAAMAAVKTSKGVVFGFNSARSRNIADIQSCLVLEKTLDEKIRALRPYLANILPDKTPCDISLQHIDGAFDLLLTGAFKRDYEFLETTAEMAEFLGLARISVREKDTQEAEILLARKKVFKTSGAVTVEIAPGAFLQASAAGEKALVDIVMRSAQNPKRCADLFCGYGTFAGHLIQSGAEVLAIENDDEAIRALQKSGHKNLRAEKRNLFKNPVSAAELRGFDCAVFDPPRAGAAAQARELAQSGIPVIIAVSCNPETLARDAKILENSGYALREATLVDQFVYSLHSEAVALFARM